MELHTERLVLRPWRDDDAPDLYEYARDERVGPAADWPPHRSVEESLAIIRSVFAQELMYAVELRATGRVVGSVGLLRGSVHPGPCRMELHVNRGNRALGFYGRMGMRRLREGDFPIGDGYFMNDYILGLEIG